jgi:selenocysteine lyase/cysteine desulfurase
VPGLVGLGEGLKYVLDRGEVELRAHQIGLTRTLLTGLAEIPQLTVYGPREAERRVGVVSISLAEVEPHDLAAILESSYRIQVRAGLHCSPRMHGALGTLQSGGAVRISFGPSNSQEDVTAILTALGEIAGGFAA